MCCPTLNSGIQRSPRRWRKRERKVLEEPPRSCPTNPPPTLEQNRESNDKGKTQENSTNVFEARFGASVNSPQKHTEFTTLPPLLSIYFTFSFPFLSPHNVFKPFKGLGESRGAFETQFFAADGAADLGY